MRVLFRWVKEEVPGPHWLGLFRRAWPAYERWFLTEGEAGRPDLETCRRHLRAHMPELVPMWERLAELSGGDDRAGRMLALYCPPPYLTGCTQAVWTKGAPFLARNYDYHPEACEGLFLMSNWHGTKVIAASDCLWGALDGMNEHGLTAALSFGGSRVVGRGFGIPLILRYVLEFSRTVDEAVEVLAKVPSHMAYNVSLLDHSGAFGVAHVRPDQRTELVREPVSTNHQHRREWEEYTRRTRSRERKNVLLRKLRTDAFTREALQDFFLRSPIYVTDYSSGHGTLYTAVYCPQEGSADFVWPGFRATRSFDSFVDAEIVVPFHSNRVDREG